MIRKDLLATAVVFFTAWYVPFFHVSLLVFFIISNATRPCCSIVTSAAQFITRAYWRIPRCIRYLVRSVMYHICSPRFECTWYEYCTYSTCSTVSTVPAQSICSLQILQIQHLRSPLWELNWIFQSKAFACYWWKAQPFSLTRSFHQRLSYQTTQCTIAADISFSPQLTIEYSIQHENMC